MKSPVAGVRQTSSGNVVSALYVTSFCKQFDSIWKMHSSN